MAEVKPPLKEEIISQLKNGQRHFSNFGYLPFSSRQFPRLSLVLLLTFFLRTLLALQPLRAQVNPDKSLFEISGDYGEDWLSDTKGEKEPQYLDALDVNRQDGSRSWGRRQSSCANWMYSKITPYMGNQCYRVHCEGIGSQRRSEQMLLNGWYPTSPDNNERYFSLAFRLVDIPLAPAPNTRGFIAQLHQGGLDPIPFRMQWEYLCPPHSAACGYYLTMLIRSNGAPVEFGPLIAGTQTDRRGIAVSLNVWTRMLFRFTTPGAAAGQAHVWLMDNSTGSWVEVGNYNSGPLGATTGERNFQWKVGLYANNEDRITLDYDNVTYGKRWNDVTKNRLTGYHKTVLALPLDEGQGFIVRDQSYRWNNGKRGDPTTDYNNNGHIVNTPRWNAYGVRGKSLRFNGANYVRVPMDKTDFDFGNYVTVSTWFRTTAHPTQNKGLLLIDENADLWKVLLYTSDNNLSFGVKHPNGTYSKVNYGFPAGKYADGEWHHVVGTFNRFTTDNRRIKLYIDGQRVLQREGIDLPIWRGNHQLAIGKFSSKGFFVGDIDEVLVRNYAMTDAQVLNLYKSYSFLEAGNRFSNISNLDIPNLIGVSLEQNYPNPADQTTTFRYTIPTGAKAQIAVHEALSGKLIKMMQAPANGQLEMNTQELKSGIYTYSLFVNGRLAASKQMMLDK